MTWYIAGIWDCLRAGKHTEARARAALAVAACDQQSLDGGSWVLAEQFGLERGPPLGVFSNTRVSQQAQLDSYHMRLFLRVVGPSSVCTVSVSSSCIWRPRRSWAIVAGLRFRIRTRSPTRTRPARVREKELRNQAPPGAMRSERSWNSLLLVSVIWPPLEPLPQPLFRRITGMRCTTFCVRMLICRHPSQPQHYKGPV